LRKILLFFCFKYLFGHILIYLLIQRTVNQRACNFTRVSFLLLPSLSINPRSSIPGVISQESSAPFKPQTPLSPIKAAQQKACQDEISAQGINLLKGWKIFEILTIL
jgi:hypothetical protein